MRDRRPQLDALVERRAFVAFSQISWILTFGLLAAVVVALDRLDVEFRMGDWPGTVITLMAFLPVALVYTYLRFDARVAGLCDTVAILSAFVPVSAVATYLGVYLGAGRPLVDEALLAADRALGFDWLAGLAMLNAHPAVAVILEEAYYSITKQVLCVLALLVIFNEYRRLQIFLIATQICLIVTAMVPAIAPAIGIYPYLEIARETHHPAISLGTMNLHVAEFLQLRSATPAIVMENMEGIVVIPSFHMAVAVLFTWAFWAVPVARWVGLGVNIAMAAATPHFGGHYIVDLFAGGAMAVVAIALASALRVSIEARLARPQSTDVDGAVAVPS